MGPFFSALCLQDLCWFVETGWPQEAEGCGQRSPSPREVVPASPRPEQAGARDGVDAFAGRKEEYHPPIGFGKTISENFFCFMWEIGINLILCCILYLSCV